MMTHFGDDQIARDLRAFRRLEATEHLDVEQRLLRHGQVVSGGARSHLVQGPHGRQGVLRALLMSLRRVQRGAGLPP